jgi:hypothetical protein
MWSDILPDTFPILCAVADITKTDNHLAPDSRDRIIEAVQEGITLAENAFKVMTDRPSDEKVVEMSKFVLGDANFEANFAQARYK